MLRRARGREPVEGAGQDAGLQAALADVVTVKLQRQRPTRLRVSDDGSTVGLWRRT